RSFVQNFHGIAYYRYMNFMPIFLHGAVKEITGYTEDEFISIQVDTSNPSQTQIKHIVTELAEARKVLSWYYNNCPEVGDPMREKARVILSAPIGFVPTE
ncbi:hypothetical protein LCGC14_3137100, partial [marine sediment metagenome]